MNVIHLREEGAAVGKLHILFTKIQLEFNEGRKMNEALAELFNFTAEATPHLIHSQMMRSGRVTVNEVGHGLCLTEVHASIQKGAHGEFARFGHAGTEDQEVIQKFLLNIGGAMT